MFCATQERLISSLSTRIPLTEDQDLSKTAPSSPAITFLSILRLCASNPRIFKDHPASAPLNTRIHCYQDHNLPCSLRLPLSPLSSFRQNPSAAER
ncbi:hypothetical protein AMECASPLE_014110 [Ameca splendens]|uniref:Uncharacterized protein n=1 Tax=Ameca splendens TaxID=208324 RepID=A0ABV0YNK6_9TELE